MIFYDCATAPSPRRARILLHEKEVPHTSVNIDLGKAEQLGDEYRAINPACTVPALKLDDGTILTDNAGIAAYLESEYPDNPMFGRTALEKALVASWTSQIEFEGFLAIAEALRNSSPHMKGRALVGPVDFAQIEQLAERGLQRIDLFFDKLNARLDGREFVAIDSFSNADILAVVAVDFAPIVRKRPQEHHSHLIAWRERLANRPSLLL
jgi:glutathione S-transferase